MENAILENLHFIVIGVMGLCLIAAGLCLTVLFWKLNGDDDECFHDSEQFGE